MGCPAPTEDFGTRAYTDGRPADEKHAGAIRATSRRSAEKIEDGAAKMNDSFYNVVKGKLFEKNDEESNGETAIDYFKEHLFSDNLYFLDEPENSMSPILQQELAGYICLLAYRLNCQFVLATHSPFMLSMQGARIYDLDSHPSVVREWWQLENMKVYYKLFERFSKRFNVSTR